MIVRLQIKGITAAEVFIQPLAAFLRPFLSKYPFLFHFGILSLALRKSKIILQAERKKYFGDLFISIRWYIIAGIAALLFLIAFFFSWFWNIAGIFLLVFTLLTVIDYILLFFMKGSIEAQRNVPERMSLGATTSIGVDFSNTYPYTVLASWIDEVPVQFQERNFRRSCAVQPRQPIAQEYTLRPLSRGEYGFERILLYARSPLQLLQRRHVFEAAQIAKVYPDTTRMKKYQLLALSDHTQFIGAKKVRRLGHSMEFEQIKEYVPGDDIRTINWKATARKGSLMVNNYTDAKSQQVYCMIDKGRAMKMPFEGLTLLDHSINAALMFLNVALMKQDKAGLVTFASKVHDVLPAERNATQMHKLMECLYRQETDFGECDYESLASLIHHKVAHRSFLLLFTNFETMASMERQLPYLRSLAARHLVCVVFFQNTLLKEIHENNADTLEGIYIKTIADRFDFEKRQVVKELRRYGILSILTTPQQLTIDVVNKYLEMKARRMI